MKIREMSDISVSIDSDKYGTRAYLNSFNGREMLHFECPELESKIISQWENVPLIDEDDLN